MKKHLIILILLITSILSCDLGMVDKMNEVEYVMKTGNLDDDESAFTTTLSYVETVAGDYYYDNIIINVTFSEDILSYSIGYHDFTCTNGEINYIGDYDSEDFSCRVTVRSYGGDVEIYLESNSVMNKEYKSNFFESNKLVIPGNITF